MSELQEPDGPTSLLAEFHGLETGQDVGPVTWVTDPAPDTDHHGPVAGSYGDAAAPRQTDGAEAMIGVKEAEVQGRPVQGGKPRLEYRVELMPFQDHPEKHISELLARLNELGKQGWRVVSVDLTFHPSYSPAAQPGMPLPVLLEREVNE